MRRPLKAFKVEKKTPPNQSDDANDSDKHLCRSNSSGHFSGHKSMLVDRG